MALAFSFIGVVFSSMEEVRGLLVMRIQRASLAWNARGSGPAGHAS